MRVLLLAGRSGGDGVDVSFFPSFFSPLELARCNCRAATALLRSVEIECGVVAGRCEGKRKPAGCVP